MRAFFSGPRLFGGFVRPGVSFGMPRWRRVPDFGTDCDSVYLIEGAPGHIKIGISRDPISRLATLQTASPFPLRLAFSVATPSALNVEREAHAILAAHRAEGEWLVDQEMAIAAIFGAASRLGVRLGEMPERKRQPGEFREPSLAVKLAIWAGLAAFVWLWTYFS